MINKTPDTNSNEKRAGSADLEKSKPHIVVEIIEYVPNSVLSKTIIKKTTGNITVMSFDTGEELTERTSPFDSFMQVIDGNAEIMIDGKTIAVNLGQGIIIPAHALSMIKAHERFKMLLTVIKSGYE